MRSGPPAPWPGGGRRLKHRPCQCRSGGVVRAALGPLAWRGNRGPAMAPAARAAPAQKSAARFIICPHDAARAGLWSAGGPRCRARICAARKMALAGYSRRARARARRCCPAAGRLERSTRRGIRPSGSVLRWRTRRIGWQRACCRNLVAAAASTREAPQLNWSVEDKHGKRHR
jgi:hypothetical protein